MTSCIRCGLPALPGSSFCGTHQNDLDGTDVLSVKGPDEGGPNRVELPGSEPGEMLAESFGPSPKDIGRS